jgi:hypothetical protein
MDEGVTYLGREGVRVRGSGFFSQQPMFSMEQITEGYQLLAQAFRGVMPVMKMDFDLAIALAAKGGQIVQDRGIVLLLGIEERVARGNPVRITKWVHAPGVGGQPIAHRLTRHVNAYAIAEGLKVIADRYNQMPSPFGWPRLGKDRPQIAR